MIGAGLEIESIEELEPLGRTASLLDVGLSLIDRDMTVLWRNATAARWFDGLDCGSNHCFASHWGRATRCPDCLPLLVFRSGEAQEGLRVRARPGEAARTYRVAALPVSSRDGNKRWVLETLVHLKGVSSAHDSQNGPALALTAAAPGTAAAFMVVDLQGRIVSWSQAAAAVFGYELDEILGRRIDILVPPGREDEPAWIMEEVKANGGIPRFETVRRASDGTLIPVALSAVALRDEAGELIGRSTIVEDLSEVRSLRARLEAHEQLLAYMAREVGGAVLAADGAGIVTSWNPEAEALLGYSESAAVGRPLGELIGEAEALVVIGAVAKGGSVRELRAQWGTANEDSVPVDVSATQLRHADGTPAGLAAIVRDARESLKMERQMVRSEKLAAVGSLAAGLAHEIGTPLNVISATAEYLLLDQPDSAVRKELGGIVTETERIGGLVRELLTFARESSATRVEVSPAEAVARVLRLLRIPIDKKRIEVSSEVPCDLPCVHADPDELHQVLLNLIVNASDAVGEGGRITVLGYIDMSQAPAVVIEIHDDGPGIDAGLRERIFDPFFTTRPEGTGLGLAVCARIVQEHGGDIRVTSSPTGGARFVLQLPVATETQ